MVNRRLVRDDPEAVSGLVRALNAALVDIVNDPDAAIETVARYNPEVNKQAERARLDGTLKLDMGHGEGKTLGIGAVDEARLARSIALIAETNKLPRMPAPDEVFTPDFLPPVEDRVTTLAGLGGELSINRCAARYGGRCFAADLILVITRIIIRLPITTRGSGKRTRSTRTT